MSRGGNNTLAWIINALIDGINQQIQLPRVLVVLLDSDVLNLSNNYSYSNMETLIQLGSRADCRMHSEVKISLT